MAPFSLQRRSFLLVVSAPSGAGKSTLIGALVDGDAALTYSVSATTRAPRGGEIHGQHYYFLSPDDFTARVAAGAFYEHFTVHGNSYGTLRSEVDGRLAAGNDVVLDIDVQGGVEIRRQHPDCVAVFVLPPSMAVLEERLRGRRSDAETDIQRRLANARAEIAVAREYDYILVNNDFEQCLRELRAIVGAERARVSRLNLSSVEAMT